MSLDIDQVELLRRQADDLELQASYTRDGAESAELRKIAAELRARAWAITRERRVIALRYRFQAQHRSPKEVSARSRLNRSNTELWKANSLTFTS